MSVAPDPAAGRPWLIAACVTPLTAAGAGVDEAALAPMVEFLRERGVDGVLAAGTTGEGILLAPEERRRLAERLRELDTGRLIVHCGAQTTAATVALAEHAAGIGADGVAVIAPPYYPLDADALTAHFVVAARACAPTPFYCYAFAARSGYPLPVEVVLRVRDAVDNLAGLKVSEQPWEAAAPYLEVGVPVLVGSEPLIPWALAAGAHGTVSGLAAAFPDLVRAALDDPSDEAGQGLAALRRKAGPGGTFIAALKHVLGMRGVPVGPDVRPPLRRLNADEVNALAAGVGPLLARPASPLP